MEYKKKSPMEINSHKSPMDIDFDWYAVEVVSTVQTNVEPPSDKEDRIARPRKGTKQRSRLKSAESKIEEPPSIPEEAPPEESQGS